MDRGVRLLDFGPGSGWSDIQQFLANPDPKKIRSDSRILPDLVDFSTFAVYADYLQLREMKLILTRHHLSDCRTV